LSTADRSLNSPGRAFGSVLSTYRQLKIDPTAAAADFDDIPFLQSVALQRSRLVGQIRNEVIALGRAVHPDGLVLGRNTSDGRELVLRVSSSPLPGDSQRTLSCCTDRLVSSLRSEWVSGDDTNTRMMVMLA